MSTLEMFKKCPKSDLSNAEWLEKRVVNITSSVRAK
jgi:perosamine synthetase